MAPSGTYVPSPSRYAADQVAEFETSDGARANTMQGLPIVVVTSIGAKSGNIRKTPLMRVEHGGKYLAVASKGGAPENPLWYYNLKANPRVVVQDGAARTEMTARELAGPERDEWWARAVEAFGNYAVYQTKTDRLIPILLLEPADRRA